MLEVSVIRNQKAELVERLKKRNKDFSEELDQVVELDAQRRRLKSELDQQLAEANTLAKSIGQLFKEGKQAEAESSKERSAELKTSSKELQEELQTIELSIANLLHTIPNVPNNIVPAGNSDSDNEEVYRSAHDISETAQGKPHWELTDQYDLIDFELGNKITGAGFPVYKGKGARLQRALINFFLDRATAAGYTEVQPPHLVNEDSGFGTGQLPDKEGQMYHMQVDNLYLIPTAEVPVTNMYRNVILKADQFPIKNTAYTPCFRREAGSYGKDVRGLNRLHQFDKVEIVQLQHPDNSYKALDEMVAYVQGLLEELGLPFRILRLCGGDLGFTSALTYDMEVYSTGQARWLEVSSISNFETFQANRLKLRFKDADGKTRLAHTLNGSALALPRIVAAILEYYQDENGIKIPEVLIPYTDFERI